jgi:glycerophosphoryl diester phosphodiesterase
MKKIFSLLGISIPAFSSDFIIIGHRGASGYEPENTLRSFERAINMGVSMIELDVYVCASGEIVVIHDDTVDRTTDGEGNVSDLSWEELKQLDAGQGQRIPLLSQVFNLVNKRVGIDIEIKDPQAVRPVAALIQEYVKKYEWSYDHFFITSFDHEAVREFHEICPEVKTGLLFEGQSLNVIELVKLTKSQSVILDYYSATKEFIADAHAKNIQVFAYTVNAKDIAEQLKSFGIDGIITDYPDILSAGA